MTNESDGKNRRLDAYEVGDARDMPLHAGTVARDWMDWTGDRFAYRCLPLLIANQAGWVIPCPTSFSATWNGGARLTDVSVEFGESAEDSRISSHFGSGIVTFRLPYLFRTPPGLALWVRGPANYPKDGASPLEGIIETDWAEVTFTMNWKLTRPKARIGFTKGEPICMVSPISLDLLESLVPQVLPRDGDPELLARFEAWSLRRQTFNDGLKQQLPEMMEQRWQKDYFLGKEGAGERGPSHRTKLELAEFTRNRGR